MTTGDSRPVRITGLDHLVLTVPDVDETIRFYQCTRLEAVTLEAGQRALAFGPMTSVYIRDPDDNLIEIAKYAQS
jgi:catechol 2,3-dioxygenase-like lactoylglutathione lyase family enzyme